MRAMGVCMKDVAWLVIIQLEVNVKMEGKCK